VPAQLREKRPDKSPSPPGQPAAPWGRYVFDPVVVSLLLAALTVAVYCQAVIFDFVNYDDPEYVTANSHVQGGLTAANMRWAFEGYHASNWHPLTWLSHIFDIQLFGVKPAGHHLTSVALHVVNTVLVFLMLRRMTGAPGRSAIVAGFFALHPLHVESVAWVSERKDVLSALFFLLTVVAYERYVSDVKCQVSGVPSVEGMGRGGGTADGDSRITHHASLIFYFLSLIFFALGLMSKPMLVTLPFVLLLLDYWPLQRVSSVERPENAECRSGITHHASRIIPLFVEKLPFFILALVSCFITFYAQKSGGSVSTSISPGARAANALMSYARYLDKTIWPWHLSVLYPHPGYWPAWEVIGAGLLLVIISFGAILLVRSRPYLFVGWFWFVGMLVPTIGVIQVGIQSMADRYTYLPLIGLFVVVVWAVGDLARVSQTGPTSQTVQPFVAVGAGCVLLVVCAALTFHQARIWKDSGALFTHAVQVTKNNYLAYNNLGFYLWGKGKVEPAIENYRAALKIQPNYEDALNNLGYALASQKKYPEAIQLYEAALRVRPNHPEVHNNLGNALSEVGRIDEAITNYLLVLKQNPEHADAHNNLGIALAMKGKLDEAIPHFREALRWKPSYASAHSNLGNALAAQQKFEEAIGEYDAALRLNPDDAQAQNNLANVLSEQGKVQEAIVHYEKALQLNAENPEAHCNLGIALARLGKRAEAEAHFREALRLRPGYTEALRRLPPPGAATTNGHK
jgi:tetratricopeptide (TPR) repeat protein